MATHTPAPWHTGGKNNSIIYAPDGWAVADANTFHGRDNGEVQAANARLIAEAPAMYEALIRLQHTLEYVHSDDAKFVAGVLNRVEGRNELTGASL